MSTWYPAATHTPSPNYDAGRNGQAVKAVCLHIAQGGYASSISWLCRPRGDSSAHFIIARDGRVCQMIGTDHTAWANGLRWKDGGWIDPEGLRVFPSWKGLTPGVNPNRQTISIEAEGNTSEPRTDAMNTATVELLVWLSQQYPQLAPYTPHGTLIGHNDISPRSRAGCPGANCDFALLAGRANRKLSPTTTADDPIIAPSRTTAEQVYRYLTRRTTGSYRPYDVRVIVGGYGAVCRRAGVDLLNVAAQLDLETDGLNSARSQRPQRNPAGIGATAADVRGAFYATWVPDAVEDHVGRLLAYALPIGAGNDEQQRLITGALHTKPLPEEYRGIAPTVRGLGGRWAEGADYGDHIAQRARDILRA